jgi:hypothetical protein
MTKQGSEQDELVGQVLKEFEQLQTDRGTLEEHWTEIAERVEPSHSKLFESKGEKVTEGEKNTHELFDSTAAIALNRFAAILDSLLTPRNQTWHRLSVSDKSLEKNRDVRLWLDDLNALLFKTRYDSRANFAAQNQQQYKSLGSYGSGGLFIDELQGGRGTRYKNTHLSESYFRENHQGIVDGNYRLFRLKAFQAVQKKEWLGTLPDAIIDAAKSNPIREFKFLHCVKPRDNYDPNRADALGMPWASYYISLEQKVMVEEGGYTSFPYAISRYQQTPGETYGRSPAMEVLPAIKTLNEQKKTMLKQGHRTVDPVLLAHDDGILDSFSLKPGAINYGGVSKDGKALVHTLPVGNLVAGKDLMDAERMVINDAFLVTLFQILVDSPQMSATEVLERTKEKGILLAPTVGRQQDEYLGPLIDREIDILMRQGLVPPMPEALREAGGEYQIVHDSPMSKTQKAGEAAGFARMVERTLAIVNVTQDASLFDMFNFEAALPEIADIEGVPARWMTDKKVLDQMKQQRAMQAQQQAAIQAAPAMASMVKAGVQSTKG